MALAPDNIVIDIMVSSDGNNNKDLGCGGCCEFQSYLSAGARWRHCCSKFPYPYLDYSPFSLSSNKDVDNFQAMTILPVIPPV